MIQALPQVAVQTEAFACKGGWDLATPPLSMKPGVARDALNFMAGINGGYERIPGYERFDGRTSPSSAVYYTLPATISGAVAVGATLTGATSGATGVVLGTSTASIYLTKIAGTYTTGESLTVSGAPVATATGGSYIGRAGSVRADAVMVAAAADVYRALIGAVPGSGPVRGVWAYNDNVYAFRDNSGATECKMYKATAAGWVVVTTPTLTPGGSYEFINENFGGASATYAMFGVSGVHKAFKFDGTTWTWITTGMTTDTPNHITAHANHLFLSFGASVQHSPIANPTGTWSAVLGAGEIAAGAEVTGFVSAIGSETTSALLISTRNKLHVLYGTSSADWKMTHMAGDSGAFPGTLQKIGPILMLDDRGITSLATSSNYGNFVENTLSQAILPWIRENRSRAVCSCVSREYNQYRLFFNNRYVLYATMRSGSTPEIMPILLKHDVVCACSSEMASGAENIYFGSSDGYVYQMDRGASFDGESIDYSLTLAFNHSKSPRVLKRYRKLALEITGGSYAEFNLAYQLGYGATKVAQPAATIVGTEGLSDVYWDSFVWDSFFWDGSSLVPTEKSMTGSAENFALVISGESALFNPFTIASVMCHYTPRRRMR